jgi:2'-5' RNA ligase
MDSALVIPVSLPPRLERERRLYVSVAAHGVPAHLTLLYPFIAPADLSDHDRQRIASILEQHPAIDYSLGGIRAWPTALYLEVLPASPFAQLVDDLNAAYPAWVPYRGEFSYVPHVTVAELRPADSLQIAHPPRFSSPRRPLGRRAERAILIVQDQADRWHTRWRFELGRQAVTVGGMP